MNFIKSANIIKITQRTLDYVDSRLSDHARRVAYMVYSVMKFAGGYTEKQLQDYFILALLHDIGAYKTEEIDEIISFDYKQVWQHSVYGQLFLSTFLDFESCEQSIFYHHLAYSSYPKAHHKLCEKSICGLISVVDRAELYIRSQCEKGVLERIAKSRGTQFSPYWVDMLNAANKSTGLLESVISGSYEAQYEEFINTFKFSFDQKRLMLETLAYSIDFRSSFMVMHNVSTISVSKTIAKRFNMSREQMLEIEFGALLHDIGKVATPVEILEKPGKLTDEEMEIMRRHVVLTKEIIQDFISPQICDIAVRHHERLDGSGYPLGLTKESLSLPQRIVAVADVVSALVRRRSYKEAFDKERTLGILAKTRDAGQLCPEVVEIIINCFDEIMDKAQAESDKLWTKYVNLKKTYVQQMTAINDYMIKNNGEPLGEWVNEYENLQ